MASPGTQSLPLADSLAKHRPGRVAWEFTANVLLALFFLRFAVINGVAFVETLRLSSLLVLVKVSTDVIFYLTRRIPDEISTSPYDWLIGVLGTYAVVFFRPAGGGGDLLWGSLLQGCGLTLQICAMLSLNRSIGMVAANRGVKTDGMYRFVRHPLYFSYLLSFGGYVLSQTSLYNVGVYLSAVLLWVLRLYAEERFLMRSPQYRDYAARTRWRMIPFVF